MTNTRNEMDGLILRLNVARIILAEEEEEEEEEARIVVSLLDITERKRAEEALQRSEKKYRDLVESAVVGVYVTNLKGDILYVNETASRMFGFDTTEELISKGAVVRYKNPKDRDVLIEILKKQGSITNFEFEALTKTGETRNILLSSAITGDVLTGMISDITERKRAEEALRQTKDQLEAILHAMADGVTVLDASGRLVYANDVVALAAGYPSAEEMLRNYDPAQSAERYNLVDEAGAPFPATQLPNRLLLDGKPAQPVTVGYRLQATGNVRWSVVQARPIFDEQGKMQFVVTVMHDITERKRAEEEIQNLAKFPSENPNPVLRIAGDGMLLYINQAGVSLLSDWHLQVGQAAPLALREAVFQSMNDGTTQMLDLEYGDGGRVYSFSVAPIVVAGYTNLYGRDITERKQAEESLRESEERYRLLVETLPDGVIVHSQGRVVFANPASARLIGAASPAELIGRRVIEFVHPDYQELALKRIRQSLSEGVLAPLAEEKFIRFDGTPIDVQVTAIPFSYAGKPAMLTVFNDITERKRAEEALRESEAKLKALIDNTADTIWSIDTEYRLTSTNATFRDGLAKFIGREISNGESVFTNVPQAIVDEWKPLYARALGGETFTHVSIAHGGLRGSVHRETFFNPIRGQDDKVVGVACFSRDITERKRAEQALAQSNEQLRALTAYWQTAIETERAYIAREIHDEFGQSMTALKMDLAWLANRLPEGDERVERIRGMTALVDSSVTLMRRIATELRPGMLDDLGLNAALEWQAYEFSRRSGIPCKLNLPKDDLALDPALNTTLFRIFQETLTNVARHAQATRLNASLKQKEQTLILTMRDNGRGISESELEDPRSLGLLGLRERANQWGGETTIRGAAGKGTTVIVRIPLPASPANGGNR